MFKFSSSEQTFYADEFKYSSYPDDLVAVSKEQHIELYEQIKKGFYIFSDLTLSKTPKPSQRHKIDLSTKNWFDPSTESEKIDFKFESLHKLDRMTFRLILLEVDIDVDELIKSVKDKQQKRLQIMYDDAQFFKPNDEFCTWLFGELKYTKQDIIDFWCIEV